MIREMSAEFRAYTFQTFGVVVCADQRAEVDQGIIPIPAVCWLSWEQVVCNIPNLGICPGS